MDPASYFVIATLMMLVNGGILGLVHRDLPDSMRASARDWRISTLLMAGGCVFFAAQGYGPPVLLVTLSNGLVLLGITGYWRALRRFYGEPDVSWLLVPSLVAVVALYWFVAHQPNLTARVIISAVAWVVILGGAIRTLTRAQDDSRSRRVLAVVFGVVAAFLGARAIYFAVAAPSLADITQRSIINVITPMVTAVLPVIGTTTFLLICSDRIRRQWERAASTDYLTGLANRRTLGAEGDGRLARARAFGDGLAIAVIDVDHFKSLNDRYGHDVGDLALKHVAARLRSACRGGDLPARQGGEEFVVVLDRVDAAQAVKAGERMRAAIAEAPFVANGSELTITVSVGIATLTATDSSFDDLLRRADQALYAAKGNGRNRVELAARAVA